MDEKKYCGLPLPEAVNALALFSCDAQTVGNYLSANGNPEASLAMFQGALLIQALLPLLKEKSELVLFQRSISANLQKKVNERNAT